MRLNQGKCQALKMGKGSGRPPWDSRLAGETLEESYCEKDLVMSIQNTLSYDCYI